MSVVKSKRTESRFEARHHFFKLRDELTLLVMNDFGFSEVKQERKREHYRQIHEHCADVEEVLRRWEVKDESFMRWFIDEEGKIVLDLLRNIEREFTIGNSIYPSETPARLLEFFERRKHMDNAIGLCYALKQEVNYILRTLPVDFNRYAHFAEELDRQIDLYKGVRKSDNRLLTPKKGYKPGSLHEHVQKLVDDVTAVVYKIGELSQIGNNK